MGLLGLDPIHLWAQSENRNPTNKFIRYEIIIFNHFIVKNPI